MRRRSDRVSGKLGFLCATAIMSLGTDPAVAQVAVVSVHEEEEGPSEEIVVTAGRRSQTVLDVPYNITALSADTLSRTGASSVNDVIRLVPGLVQNDQGPALYGSGNNVIMRGLNAQSQSRIGTGGTTQTVSPVSTYFGNVPIFFALTMNDIERVEVLRGPQGTLYGSGSVGGTLRFIPKKPQSGQFLAEARSGFGWSERAGSPNYDLGAVFNLPISGAITLRAVGGYQRLAGFIDAVGLVATDTQDPFGIPSRRVASDIASGFVLAPREDTNSSANWFARGTLRWEASEAAIVDLTYHHERTAVDDAQSVNSFWQGQTVDYSVADFPGSRGRNRDTTTPAGGLYPNGATFLPDGGKYRSTSFIRQYNDRDVDLVSLDASMDLGFATVTSTTTYADNQVDFLTNNTDLYLNVSNPAGGYPLASFYNYYPRLMAPTLNERRNRVFTEELRLASEGSNIIDYVAGVYYSKDRQRDIVHQSNPGILAFSNATTRFHANPEARDLNWHADRRITFEDKALFGEVTAHLTPKWQVTGGVRVFWQRFANSYRQEYPICGLYCGDGFSPGQQRGGSFVSRTRSFHRAVKKLNTSYEPSPGIRVYATYSEGFRRGGANTVANSGNFASLPAYQSFEPDFARNYEIGFKGSVRRRVDFTLALFQIDWSAFQFEALTPSAIPAVFNGNEARSRGGEIEWTARVSDALTLSAGYAYTDARLTRSFEIIDLPQYGGRPIVAIRGAAGARLPATPRHSLSGFIDYRTSLRDSGWTIGANLNASYRSSIVAALPSASSFFYSIPGYGLVGSRFTLDKGEAWGVDLTVQNLTNSLARSSGPPAQYTGPFSFANIARPRTITLGAHWRL